MTKKKVSLYRWSSVDKVYIINCLQKIFTNEKSSAFVRLLALQSLIHMSVRTKLMEEETCVSLVIPILKTLILATCVRLVKRNVLIPDHFLPVPEKQDEDDELDKRNGRNQKKINKYKPSNDPLEIMRTWDIENIKNNISLEEIPYDISHESSCSYTALIELVQDYTSLFLQGLLWSAGY